MQEKCKGYVSSSKLTWLCIQDSTLYRTGDTTAVCSIAAETPPTSESSWNEHIPGPGEFFF